MLFRHTCLKNPTSLHVLKLTGRAFLHIPPPQTRKTSPCQCCSRKLHVLELIFRPFSVVERVAIGLLSRHTSDTCTARTPTSSCRGTNFLRSSYIKHSPLVFPRLDTLGESTGNHRWPC